MVLKVNALPAVTALVAAAAPGLAVTPASATSRSSDRPSATQIRTAVHRAERSRNLWATVNICNTKRHPHVIGIRGQMPALGFKATLMMDIQVDYWNTEHRTFEPDPAAKKQVLLGRATSGLHQDGVSFRFDPPAVLSGRITFTWKLAGKVIGHASRRTANGPKHVDFGDPPGHNTSTCRIGS